MHMERTSEVWRREGRIEGVQRRGGQGYEHARHRVEERGWAGERMLKDGEDRDAYMQGTEWTSEVGKRRGGVERRMDESRSRMG